MRRLTLLFTTAITALAPIAFAQSTGPYKVLKTAKVGGEGGTDYICADTASRRLFNPQTLEAFNTQGNGAVAIV